MDYENTGLPLVLLFEQAGVIFGIPFGETNGGGTCQCRFPNLTQTLSEQTMDKDFFQRDISVARINEVESDNETSAVTLNDAILESAKSPKRVQGDAGSVEQHPLQDLIVAERFLQSKKAMQGNGFPLRLHKISPDGTT